jgi:hypothetical protein
MDVVAEYPDHPCDDAQLRAAMGHLCELIAGCVRAQAWSPACSPAEGQLPPEPRSGDRGVARGDRPEALQQGLGQPPIALDVELRVRPVRAERLDPRTLGP